MTAVAWMRKVGVLVSSSTCRQGGDASTACCSGATQLHLPTFARAGQQAPAVGHPSASRPSRRSSRRLAGQKKKSQPHSGRSQSSPRPLPHRIDHPRADHLSGLQPPNRGLPSAEPTAAAVGRCSPVPACMMRLLAELGASARATPRWRSGGVSTREDRPLTRVALST